MAAVGTPARPPKPCGRDPQGRANLGRTAGFREATDVIPGRDERELIGPHKAAARDRLDEAAWNEEWERGRSMTLDQVVDYALDGVAEHAKGQRRHGKVDSVATVRGACGATTWPTVG